MIVRRRLVFPDIQAGTGDLRAVEIEGAQLFESEQFDDDAVGDLGMAEVECFQLGQAGQRRDADCANRSDEGFSSSGIDHVGIGSDFDGVSGPPNGLDDVSRMPALIAALLERGYSDRDLKKILGENTLRVIREVTGK